MQPRQLLTVIQHQENAVGSIVLEQITKAFVGNVNLSASGPANLLYVFEASTNLLTWTKLGVRTNLTGTAGFVDAGQAAIYQRFYRVSAP